MGRAIALATDREARARHFDTLREAREAREGGAAPELAQPSTIGSSGEAYR